MARIMSAGVAAGKPHPPAAVARRSRARRFCPSEVEPTRPIWVVLRRRFAGDATIARHVGWNHRGRARVGRRRRRHRGLSAGGTRFGGPGPAQRDRRAHHVPHIQRPSLWWYYAAVATAGAVLGSLPLYLLAKRGGEAFLDRRLSGPRTGAAVAWYRQSAFARDCHPGLRAAADAAQGVRAARRRHRVLAVARDCRITLGRGARHLIETQLALRYRDQAVAAVERYGAIGAVAVMALVTVLGLGAYLWHMRQQAA